MCLNSSMVSGSICHLEAPPLKTKTMSSGSNANAIRNASFPPLVGVTEFPQGMTNACLAPRPAASRARSGVTVIAPSARRSAQVSSAWAAR